MTRISSNPGQGNIFSCNRGWKKKRIQAVLTQAASPLGIRVKVKMVIPGQGIMAGKVNIRGVIDSRRFDMTLHSTDLMIVTIQKEHTDTMIDCFNAFFGETPFVRHEDRTKPNTITYRWGRNELVARAGLQMTRIDAKHTNIQTLPLN
ncbi:MAG: hypothetical protein HQ564_02680 [Candidatus Saganbacteria bacterium]|nr:hypothetical protein [Candidatus Saganbacteria bacterium]